MRVCTREEEREAREETRGATIIYVPVPELSRTRHANPRPISIARDSLLQLPNPCRLPETDKLATASNVCSEMRDQMQEPLLREVQVVPS